jgi:hypothetical protein
MIISPFINFNISFQPKLFIIVTSTNLSISIIRNISSDYRIIWPLFSEVKPIHLKPTSLLALVRFDSNRTIP